VEQKLREIEGYLAFVVTHCDSEIIANALNYKLKVEKAVYKLSFSGLTEKTHKSEQVNSLTQFYLNSTLNLFH